MEKNKTKRKGLLINIDIPTYESLRSEQRKYHINMRKKISLADVIMHYYQIGFSKADKRLFSGLRIIENKEIKTSIETSEKLSGVEKSEDLTKSVLLLMKNRDTNLKQKEEQLIKREELIFEKLLSKEAVATNTIPNQAQVELARMSLELAFLKEEFDTFKKFKNSNNRNIDFEKIEKSLITIEQQTKKSTLDSILPFISPLLMILAYFLMNKKLDKKMNLDGIQKQIAMIFNKLNDNEKKYVTQIIEKTLDDIL